MIIVLKIHIETVCIVYNEIYFFQTSIEGLVLEMTVSYTKSQQRGMRTEGKDEEENRSAFSGTLYDMDAGYRICSSGDRK